MTDPATFGPYGAPYLAVDVQPDILDDIFTLDVSQLNGPDVLGWTEEDAGTWVNVVCDVTRAGLRRGATRLQGVLTRAEAGVATVTVTDYSSLLDPLTNGATIHKGAPFRLRAWGIQTTAEWVPTRTNLAINPSVAVDATNWSIVANGTFTGVRQATGGPGGGPFYRASWSAVGTGSGSVQLGSTTAYGAVTAGQTVALSMWTRANRSRGLRILPQWRRADGTTYAGTTGATVTPAANTWTQIGTTLVVPADAVGVFTRLNTSQTMTVGDTLDTTQVLWEVAATVGTFFDGDTPDTSGVSYSWTGTPYVSPSVLSVFVEDAVPWEAVLFTGEVDEVNATYVPGLPATVTVTASDLIAALAAWEAPGRTGNGIGAGDTLLARVNRMLDEADIGTVNTAASDTTYTATLNPSVLDRAWDVIVAAADAELGRVWVDTSNQLVVRSRTSVLTGPVRGTLSDVHADAVETPHVCMSAAAVVHGVELLANRATASRRLISTDNPATALVVTRDDTYSQARYGVGAVDRRGQLELATDVQLTPWADAVIAAGAKPELRVDTVTPFPTEDDLIEAMGQWPAVMATGIGDRVRFRFHPLPGHSVDRVLGVVGVEMDLSPDAWNITWTTTG